jgi:ComF family protein
MLYDLLSLIFPRYCYACLQGLVSGEKYVCTDCRIKLPYTNLHLAPEDSQDILQRRFWGRVPVRFVLSYLYFRRAGRVQRLLHQLKYRGAEDLGEALGTWYGSELKEHGYNHHFDLIVPVPLHPQKQRQRGYNQAEKFAQGLASELNVPCSSKILTREKYSDTQTRRSREERWQNVEGIFRVAKAEEIKDQRILIVDDVITTGATLEACANALLQADCKEVSVVAIAAAE